jgi:hypothetical protein
MTTEPRPSFTELRSSFTDFMVDPKDDLYEDLGAICQELYPGCKLFYSGLRDGMHAYTIDKEIDLKEFKKKIDECKEDCKQKRLELMNTVVCQVVKIKGEYYIKDGDKKIALFE